MNEETKKIRDELAYSYLEYQTHKDIEDAFRDGFSQGHATAMKDVESLKEVIKMHHEMWSHDDGLCSVECRVLCTALSRFTQTQTEKDDV